jgi:hypothetical protein
MKQTRLLPGMFLAALLIGVQGALALHAFEHDLGAPPGKVCGTCVTASQMAAGSIDSHAGDALAPAQQRFIPTVSRGFESAYTGPVRQRGPPSSS